MLNFLKKYSPIKTVTAENQHVDTMGKTEPSEKNNMTPENFNKKIGSLGNDPLHFSRKLLSLLAKEKEISQGVFFIADKKDGKSVLRFLSGYAFENPDTENLEIEFGEGFPGQVAKDGKLINISEVPDGYISIVSGLGKASPASIIIFPVINDKDVIAVIELASFHRFTEEDEGFFNEISKSIATRLAKLSINN
jgi:putative methionine-R-sulfoxide reductase with GAF domain